MPDLRGALIGCGWFARNHMNAWNEIGKTLGARIVAVCDPDANKAADFAREFGAIAYHDAAAMLDELAPVSALDFVDIATSPETHSALVQLAAAHGLPVICQKPMANSLEDARAMVAACSEVSVPFMVHENFRWQKPMREAKRAADLLDTPFFCRIVFRNDHDIYTNQPFLAEIERFIIADLGVHLLDLARFFLGDVARLTCLTQKVNPRLKGEDTATFLMQMQSGATCVVEACYYSHLEEDIFPQTLVHLEAANGSVTLGPHYQLTIVHDGRVERRDLKPTPYPWSVTPGDAVSESVVAIQRHWIECLQTGQTPETSGADNLRTLELVYGAYHSAETGQPYSPANQSEHRVREGGHSAERPTA